MSPVTVGRRDRSVFSLAHGRSHNPPNTQRRFAGGHLRLSALGTIALFTLGGSAGAQDYSWQNPVSGNWTTPANWLGGTPGHLTPNGATANVLINAADGGNPANSYTVALNNGVTIANLLIDSPQATLNLGAGAQINTPGPIRVTRGTLTLGGVFFFNTPSMFRIDAAASLLVSSNTTIPAGVPLTLDGFLNINAATLQVTNAAGFTNRGVVSLSGNTAAWLFMQAPLINEGHLGISSAPAGVVHQLSAGLTNQPGGLVTVGADLNVFSGNTVNRGSFIVADNVNYDLGGRAFTQEDGDLSPIGRIRCATFNMAGGTITNQLYIAPSGGAVTFNYTGGTASNAPIINGSFSGAIFNNITPLGTQDFILQGNVSAFGGVNPGQTITLEGNNINRTTVHLMSTFINHGDLVLGTDLIGNGPQVLVGPGGSFRNAADGVFVGTGELGSITSPVNLFVNEGILAPRGVLPGIGLMKFVTDITRFTASSSFDVGFGMLTSLVLTDFLEITGAAELNGEVHVTVPNGIQLHIGQHFTILTASSAHTGAFTSVIVDGPPTGAQFTLFYSTYGVDLVVTQAPTPAAGGALVLGVLAGCRRRRA